MKSLKNFDKIKDNKNKYMENNVKIAKDLSTGIINKMFGEDRFDVSFEEGNGILKVNVGGQDVSFLIGQHGKNLLALQFLIRQMYVNTTGDFEESLKLVIDIDGYKEKRVEKLKSFADNAVQKAKEINSEVSLPIMTSYERFIIHDYIAQTYPEVQTLSVGEEPNRKIVVSLK